MGVKHPRPHTAASHKTHHQTGYHKPVRNPTTNYAKDTHKDFCKRCIKAHGGICPETSTMRASFACSL
jgi:hypothetical protein